VKTSSLIGKVNEKIEVLKQNKTTFTAADVAVDTLVADLEEKRDAASKKEAEQETKKTELKDCTEAASKAATDLYEFFSDKVDTVAGAVGKKTNLGKQVLKLRSSLRGRPASPATTDASKAA